MSIPQTCASELNQLSFRGRQRYNSLDMNGSHATVDWTHLARCVASIALAVLLTAARVDAAEAAVVRVPLPIVGDVDQNVRRQVARIANQDADPAEGQRPDRDL